NRRAARAASGRRRTIPASSCISDNPSRNRSLLSSKRGRARMTANLTSLALIALSMIVTVAVLLVVRRWLPARIADDFAAIGPSAATFGVLYSVILASTVVASWSRYEGANELV